MNYIPSNTPYYVLKLLFIVLQATCFGQPTFHLKVSA
jgi:hypothetical protein